MSNFGLGIFALGEQQAAENKAARLNGAGEAAEASVAAQINRSWEKTHGSYVFRAESHVHKLRANIVAHERVKDLLIAALKAENANHPLASKEAIDAAVENERVKAILDPEVIIETYKDGKLPEGAVAGSPPGGYSIA